MPPLPPIAQSIMVVPSSSSISSLSYYRCGRLLCAFLYPIERGEAHTDRIETIGYVTLRLSVPDAQFSLLLLTLSSAHMPYNIRPYVDVRVPRQWKDYWSHLTVEFSDCPEGTSSCSKPSSRCVLTEILVAIRDRNLIYCCNLLQQSQYYPAHWEITVCYLEYFVENFSCDAYRLGRDIHIHSGSQVRPP